MTTVELTIQNPQFSSSVIKPIMSEVLEGSLFNLKDLMKAYKSKLAHEEAFANCTSDMVAHI